MARRRGGDKPVERLRTSWTSDADLEETLASMFHTDAVPGDKLAPSEEAPPADPPRVSKPGTTSPPDKLSDASSAAPVVSPPAKLAGAAPGILPPAPPVSLSGPLYETLDGLVVDSKCIRPFDAPQQAHTPSEQQVYTAMWRLLGPGGGGDSREGLLPMRAIAAKVSLSVRNLRRVLHSLVDKLAVDVTEYEDKTKSIPRRYRVWSPKLVVDRRHRAGYTHVYRNRNLITLARPHDNLPGDDRPS